MKTFARKFFAAVSRCRPPHSAVRAPTSPMRAGRRSTLARQREMAVRWRSERDAGVSCDKLSRKAFCLADCGIRWRVLAYRPCQMSQRRAVFRHFRFELALGIRNRLAGASFSCVVRYLETGFMFGLAPALRWPAANLTGVILGIATRFHERPARSRG